MADRPARRCRRRRRLGAARMADGAEGPDGAGARAAACGAVVLWARRRPTEDADGGGRGGRAAMPIARLRVMRSVRCATRRLFQTGTGLAMSHLRRDRSGRATSAPGLAQRWFGQHLKRHSPQCSMLHRSAACCTAAQHVAPQRSMLHRSAACCTAAQHVATQCGQVPQGTGACPGWGALVTPVLKATRGSRVP
jgi:hypothetical protein